jgi:hypothetical protein
MKKQFGCDLLQRLKKEVSKEVRRFWEEKGMPPCQRGVRAFTDLIDCKRLELSRFRWAGCSARAKSLSLFRG